MRRWLIIPVKPFDQAKSRLATVLSRAERAALSAHLLQQTLCIASGAGCFDEIVVVSRDPSVLSLAAAWNVTALLEEKRADLDTDPDTVLNVALTQACNYAETSGAEAALLLPSDLPRLRSEDLHEIVATFSAHPHAVVLAPSQDGGTNAMMCPLPAPFPFAFGAQSLSMHRSLARSAGYVVAVVERATLAFDLDAPADLYEISADPAWQSFAKTTMVQTNCKML